MEGIRPINRRLYVTLLHYPVYNKSGDVVTTAITNLDLHDIARVSKTFGVAGYYVINPQPAQRELAGRILSHWTDGWGSTYNPNRREAFESVSVVADMGEAVSGIEALQGEKPKIIATAAKGAKNAIGYADAREMMEAGGVYLLVFGTGWGLTTEFLEGCDHTLKPVEGVEGYNHLPVRSAVSIILDRLLGLR